MEDKAYPYYPLRFKQHPLEDAGTCFITFTKIIGINYHVTVHQVQPFSRQSASGASSYNSNIKKTEASGGLSLYKLRYHQPEVIAISYPFRYF